MKDLLTFDSMITPKIITIFYYLGLLAVLLFGLGTIFSGFFFGGFSFYSLFIGIAIILIGGLSVRIYCELLIILFKMNEALQDIRRK